MGNTQDDIISEFDIEDGNPETLTVKFTYHNGSTVQTAPTLDSTGYDSLRSAAVTGGSTWSSAAANALGSYWTTLGGLPSQREIACKERTRKHCLRYDPSAA